MQRKDPRSVLVVVLDNLGDAMMGSALLPPLRRLFPQARLGLWVKAYAAALFDLGPSVRLHAADPFWDAAPGRRRGSLAPFLRSVAEIRRERYEAAFFLNTEWRRAFAGLLAGIPQRIGYRQRKSGLFLTHALQPPEKPLHFIDEHARLLTHWLESPLPDGELRYDIGVTQRHREEGAHWRAGLPWPDARLAFFHPLTGDPLKDWPLPAWRALIGEAASRWPDLRFVALSSPAERVRIEAGLASLPPERFAVAVCGLPAMKSILTQAAVLIDGDSGPGHLAAALDVPVLTLFGPTRPGRTGPRGRRIGRLHAAAVAEIGVREVLEELGRLL